MRLWRLTRNAMVLAGALVVALYLILSDDSDGRGRRRLGERPR